MKTQLVELLGKDTLRESVDLFPYLSMRLHTIAQFFFEAKTKEDLKAVIEASHKLHVPLTFLGGGSNTIFASPKVEGIVVKNSVAFIEVGKVENGFAQVQVGSGTQMGALIQRLIDEGLSGLEYHKGLPGTVGGAIYMNSKWTHPVSYVGDMVHTAELIDAQGILKIVDKDYFKFAYDYSSLQESHEYLLSVTFRLKKKDPQDVLAQANESFAYRKKTQPQGEATCGCFFQNISVVEKQSLGVSTQSAGYLIDQSGMKGKRVGSFAVSQVHANFIVNEGGEARPEDLAQLVKDVKQAVKAKYGVELKEEVRIE